MKLSNGQITILCSRERTTIEIRDGDASTTFCKVELTAEQFVSALGRLSNVDCEVEVRGLDKVGKRHENTSMEFEIDGPFRYRPDGDFSSVHELAIAACPEGWTPDNYYGSKGSFFERDGKHYARTTIRRWI